VNAHSGQPKPNLRCERKALSGSEGLLLEIILLGLEVTAEGVSVGTLLEHWRERISDCRSCNAEIINIFV